MNDNLIWVDGYTQGQREFLWILLGRDPEYAGPEIMKRLGNGQKYFLLA